MGSPICVDTCIFFAFYFIKIVQVLGTIRINSYSCFIPRPWNDVTSVAGPILHFACPFWIFGLDFEIIVLVVTATWSRQLSILFLKSQTEEGSQTKLKLLKMRRHISKSWTKTEEEERKQERDMRKVCVGPNTTACTGNGSVRVLKYSKRSAVVFL